MFALIASGGGDRCPTSTGGATQVQPCFGDLDDSWEVVSHQFDRVTMFTRAHNLCHDNRQLIVIAINRNHSASKVNCN